VIGLDWGSE